MITPFPGGIAASGSKAGSRYKFSIASTYAEYCPTLRATSGAQSKLPPAWNSIMEVIINGRDLPTITEATAHGNRSLPGHAGPDARSPPATTAADWARASSISIPAPASLTCH